MNKILYLRVCLDFAAVALILLCLAYWWLGNLSHEIFGASLFALVIAHNVFNRRWYGGLGKRKWDAVRIVNVATILFLALGMVVMFVTSLLISRDLSPHTALEGGFFVREIHMFASYWLLLILAVHLGTRWQVLMNICARMVGLKERSAYRTAILRTATLAVAAWGVKCVSDMGFGTKLLLNYSLDMWDFNDAAIPFFLNYAAIIGLFAAITHYSLIALQRRRS